jgi:hypothetical protein
VGYVGYEQLRLLLQAMPVASNVGYRRLRRLRQIRLQALSTAAVPVMAWREGHALFLPVGSSLIESIPYF